MTERDQKQKIEELRKVFGVPNSYIWASNYVLTGEKPEWLQRIIDSELRLAKQDGSLFQVVENANREISRLQEENNNIRIAFGYLNKNKKHLWNKVHTQKRLREDMRERERSKFRKGLDDKWEEIKKEHDGFCKCGMKSHCEFYGITSIKEIFDELKNSLGESGS